MLYRRRTDLREDTLQMSGTVSHSSRRAHLLTTDKVGGVTAYGRRALYEVILITWLKEPTDFYSCK